MSDEIKPEENVANPVEQEGEERQQLKSRRDFLRSLGRWSAVLIGAAVGGNLLDTPEAAGWVNGGRAWVNARGGWINGGRAWVNGGGGSASWVNRSGGWVNGGRAWINGGGGGGSAGWVNRSGGGGGAAWVNRRGY